MNPFDKWNNQEDVVDLNQWFASQRAASAPKPESKKQKDFFTDQISTAGGIIGGLAGIPLGLLGVGGGSAAGSAVGEAIENLITGEDVTKNLAQEAILGGVFGAGPIRLGKAIIGAGKGVVGDAVQAGARGASQTPLKTSAQGRMQDLGNQALTSQYGTISKPVARATNPSETIGQLADYGITNPQDAERIADAITGSNGIINRAVVQSVSGARGVNTDGLRRIADDAIQLNGIVDKDAASVKSVIEAQFRKLEGGPAGSINPNANPNDVFEVMKALEKRAANLRGRGANNRMTTPEREDQARVLLQVRDELEDRLFQASGADQNVSKVLTPQIREQLVNLQPNNPRWQSFVDDNIMTAQGVRELRSATSPFVRASQIIDDGDMNALTFGGRGGNLFQNLMSGQGIGGAIAGAASSVAQAPLARAAGSALRGGSVKVADGRTVSKPNVRSPLGVIGGAGLVAPTISSGIDTLQGEVTPDLETALMSAQIPQQTAAQGSAAEQSPYSRDNLLYDINRDPQNAEKYITYYQSLQEVYAQPTSGSSATQQKALTQSANGENTIAQLETLLANAGGGQGNIGGNISGFLGDVGFNNEAKTYNDLARGSVAQIAKALGETGALSDTDIALYSAMLPKITDTPEVARNKIVALRQRLQNARQNTMLYGGSSDPSVENAL